MILPHVSVVWCRREWKCAGWCGGWWKVWEGGGGWWRVLEGGDTTIYLVHHVNKSNILHAFYNSTAF